MELPTAEQIRTLAPDAAAARAGIGLADTRHWSGTGRSPSAAWGLCQGSGASPYQTAVDLAGPAYRCSCPSHKIPCKHALGLLFLAAAGRVADAPPPEWVSQWLESRAARAAGAATRAERQPVVDETARVRRVESREKKVAAGLDELDRWLADLIRRGLDSAHGEGYRFWDAMAARLVDAQAGGLGRAVRSLGSIAGSGDSWPHLLLEQSARVHLIAQAYRRADDLPAPLRDDVRSLVGWTTKEEDLADDDAVTDRWLVVGRRVDDNGQVMTARTFLLGAGTGRFALHLAFGVNDAPPTLLAAPGSAFRATVAFYPSATPLRATVRPILVPEGDVSALPAVESIEAMLRSHAGRLAANPFVDSWPVALRVVPVVDRGALYVREDDTALALPVAPRSLGPQLLSLSGGRPVTLVAEWDARALRPLGAIADGRFVAVDGGAAGREPVGARDEGWLDLVSAALLGTERAGGSLDIPQVAAPLVDRVDRERSILAAAAVVAARERAGRRPVVGTSAPSPAPVDPRPPVGREAAHVLGLILTEHRALLREGLELVRASHRRFPEEWLPAALAASDPQVREVVAELGGTRVAWLAATVPGIAAPPTDAVGGDWDEAWQATVSPRERAALVGRWRQADPGRACEWLAGRFRELDWEDRAAAIIALATELAPADEPLLDTALHDRRSEVRRIAMRLLARLPESAFTRLIEARARPLLVGQGLIRAGLAVTLPALDPELEAAGFGGKGPAGIGERAWLMRQLIGHVNPARWTEWLGAEPGPLVERALRTDEAAAVVAGWLDASATFADVAWSIALLSRPKAEEIASADVGVLVESLTADGRAVLTAAVGRSVSPATLARLAAACPAPWPRPVVDAVFAAVSMLRDAQYPDQAYFTLVRAAAVAVPPDRAEELASLAAFGGRVRPALVETIETIQFRAWLHSVFAAQPAPVTTAVTEGAR